MDKRDYHQFLYDQLETHEESKSVENTEDHSEYESRVNVDDLFGALSVSEPKRSDSNDEEKNVYHFITAERLSRIREFRKKREEAERMNPSEKRGMEKIVEEPSESPKKRSRSDSESMVSDDKVSEEVSTSTDPEMTQSVLLANFFATRRSNDRLYDENANETSDESVPDEEITEVRRNIEESRRHMNEMLESIRAMQDSMGFIDVNEEENKEENVKNECVRGSPIDGSASLIDELKKYEIDENATFKKYGFDDYMGIKKMIHDTLNMDEDVESFFSEKRLKNFYKLSIICGRNFNDAKVSKERQNRGFSYDENAFWIDFHIKHFLDDFIKMTRVNFNILDENGKIEVHNVIKSNFKKLSDKMKDGVMERNIEFSSFLSKVGEEIMNVISLENRVIRENQVPKEVTLLCSDMVNLVVYREGNER